MDNDLIDRLKKISDAEAIREARDKFLKTDFKYSLFKTLYETAKEKINMLKELGHDFRIVRYNHNDTNRGIHWDGKSSFLDVDDEGFIGDDGIITSIRSNNYPSSVEWKEFIRIFYREAGIQVIYIRQFDIRNNTIIKQSFDIGSTQENIKIEIPIKTPIELTVDDNLHAVWNSLSNDKLVDAMINSTIKYYERINNL